MQVEFHTVFNFLLYCTIKLQKILVEISIQNSKFKNL